MTTDPSSAAATIAPFVAMIAAAAQLLTLLVFIGRWAGGVEGRLARGATDPQPLPPGPPKPVVDDDWTKDLSERLMYLERNRVTPEQFNDFCNRLDKRLDKMGQDASNWNTQLQRKVGEMSTDVKIMKQEALVLERHVRSITRRGVSLDHHPDDKTRRDDGG
jgi:hypothetical protein